MSKCGRNLLGSLKTLAILTLSVVTGFSNSVRAGAQTTQTPSQYNFGNVAIHETSLPEKITVKNTETSSITIDLYAVTGGPYAISTANSTCPNPGSLGAGATCTVAVTVAPTGLGAVPTGTLRLNTTATNTPQQVIFSATGVEPVTLSSTGLAFGAVMLNTTSGSMSVQLANNQAISETINALSVTPGNGFALAGATTCSVHGQLTARSSCNIALTFSPTVLGPAPATTLSVTTSQSATPIAIPLNGTGIAPTGLRFLPTSLSFGGQVVGETSLIQTFTFKNLQTTTLTISSIIAPAGGFAIDPSTTCANPGTLAAGATCTVGVTFTPTALGQAPTGSVVISTNAGNNPRSVPVAGYGLAPAAFSSTAIQFGNVALNEASAIRTVTVTNNQKRQTLSFSSIAPIGDTQFAIDPSTTCSAATPLAVSGAPGSSCTLAFTFTPTSAGTQPNGMAAVGFNASNSPQTVTLYGAGVQDTTVSPDYLAFGDVVVNTLSATKTVKLYNLQAGTLSITQLIFGGPFRLDTSSNTTCPISGGTVKGKLAGNSSCLIGIKFAPTAMGYIPNGQVTVISSSPTGPMAIGLAGTGETAVALSPASLQFGNAPINITSAPSNIVVTNNRSVNLDFATIAVPAPYAIYAGSTTCVVGTPVLPGKSCVVSITVDPTAVGSVATKSLTLDDDAPGSPQLAGLYATATPQVQINPSTIAFGSLVVGQKNIGTATLTNYLPSSIVIDSIASFTAPYVLDSRVTTCPLSPEALGARLSCKIGIDVTPAAIGSQPGSATLIYNVSGSSTMVDLPIAMTGTASQPVTISPSPASFPTQFVGATSPVVPIEIMNLRDVPLKISGITLGGTDPTDFAIAGNLCPVAPATLPVNSNCTVNLTFTPAASGGRTATLSVADNALGSPQAISLSGDGNAPLKVSPLSITSYQANVGVISAYQTVTITNQTTNSITLNAFQLSGDFQQKSSTCGAVLPYALAGGASCNVTISFAPTIGGTRTGQLQVIDTAATSPQVVNLQGQANNPLTLSQFAMVYSAQLVGSTSPAKVLTLINRMSESASFTLTPSGPFSATTNCTTGTITANSSCNLYVNYSPTTATPAAQAGSITVNDSAPGGSPLVLSITGTATATNPAPAVAVVSPGAAAGGSSPTVVNVTITGNGWTHFSSSSVITFPVTGSAYASDITVNSFTAVSPNTINASLTIAASPVFGARNIKVVTPLSGGGSETATLNSAFIISDPSQTFEIASITPGVGTQGQGYLGVAPLTVNIVATGTSFVQGTTYANFGDGVSVESLDITSPTTATAVLAISNTTTVGYRSLTMVTGGQVANSILNNGNPLFHIGPNSATLTGVNLATVSGGVVTCTATPVSVAQSFAGPVCLTATGTHFLQNATGVTITGGVIVGDTIVTSQTTAYSNVIVPANATIGVDNVTVATGGEIATLPNSFTVTGSTPALISVSPNAGQQGQSLNVTITGNSYTAFNACPGGVLTADFTGLISTGSIVVNSAHKVTVPISINENAPTGGITANLTCGGEGSATIFPFGFTIQASSASITSLTLSSVPQGGQVTLTATGLNTNWSQADTNAAFYPTPNATPLVNKVTINSATSAKLAISVPTNTPPGAYSFYMVAGGQVVSASINVYVNPPTLTMSPANGLVPSTGTNSFNVSFTGQFAHFSQSGTVPVISGEGVTLTNFTVNNLVGATGTINVAAGAATGSHLITFTTGGEIVTTYFNVTSIPVSIVSVSPDHGAQSTTMNVEIVGLNTHFVSGSTKVIFGGPQITVNTIAVSSPTKLIANITTSYTPTGGSLTPTPPGWNAVYVNDPTEQLIAGFLVDAPATPSLVSACATADLPTCVASAPQGSSGTNVTITGSLTSWNSSSELVMGAGITVADLVIVNPTTATATISVSPTAPVGGNSVIMITPLTGGGFEYDSGAGFSVTPSAAYISAVSLPACATSTDTNFIADFCNNGTTGIPPVVSQLQTSILDVTGVGTHWLQGETTFSFGSGVVLDQTTIVDPTHATVQITVLSTAPVGFATATASTDGENASLQQAIDIEEGSPTFLAFSPQGAQQGATLEVEVLGRFTNWSAATPPVTEFNQDITVNSLTVVDSETLTMNVTVSPWAYVDGSSCGHVLTITSGSEQVSSSQINDNLCASAGAQEITGVSPNAAGQDSSLQVTITGAQTNFLAGQTQVSFNDSGIQVGVPIVNSLTSLTVPIVVTATATPGLHNVTVTTYGQIATQADAFTADPSVAQLTGAIPYQAEQGVQGLKVRLMGQYTHFSAASTATFGPGITVVGSPTRVSDTEIDATIDIDPLSYVGARTVTVTTPGISCADQPPEDLNIQGVTYQGCTPGVSTGTGSEIVSASVFTIVQGPAIITNVSPNTGNEGQEIVFTITGLDTHWQQNFTQFYIAGGGSDITVNDVIINSATSASVDMTISQTANPGARSIYMVTAGESLTDSVTFVVTGGVPAISYLTPNSAQPGAAALQVTIVGNAYTQWVQGTTTVNFGPGITLDSFEVTDASHIAADITIGATCTSPGVPAGCAQYGYRTVVVQTGAQGLTGSFDVVAPPPPPTPYVGNESPTTGIPGQTVNVYFYGVNTEWNPSPTGGTTLTGWDANNITVNTYQIVSPTEAIANITISPDAPAETMGLIFTTNGTTYDDHCTGCEVDDASFTIVIAQPTLSIVDPGSGLQGAQNITVNILGQFTAFDSTTTFSFGGPGSGIAVTGPPTILGPAIATQSISIGQETNTGGYAVVANTPDAPANARVVGGASFSVTPSLATILSVLPNTSPQGTQISVTLTGEDTHWSPASVFTFGAGIVVTSVDVTSETSANLTLAIPTYAPEGTTYAQATTGGEVATLNQAFVITAGTPYLLSSGPGSVEQQGSAVFTILAQATNWSSASPPVVSYGGNITLGTVQVTSPTTLTVDGSVSPTAYPGYQNLTVTTGTQVLGLSNAVYIGPGPAVINSVSPNTGGQGVTLANVQINGINTHCVQGVTTLTFPGVLVNSFTVTSPTSITANITVDLTTTPGQVNVTATTLGEVATEVNAFTITQTQAELVFIDPASLSQGQTSNLAITGIDTTFSASSVVTSTSAGVTINSVTFNSATSLTANVTVSPTISLGYKNITVTTGAQVVASNSLFQVTTGPAAISSLNPNDGGEGQTVQVVVTGSQTHFASGVTSASFAGGISVTGITVQ
ncbi:MAG: choice-of-anchor D domain-containing protein, partial [Terracidiphilus sp.]